MVFVILAIVTPLAPLAQGADLREMAPILAGLLGLVTVLIILVFARRLPHELRSMMTYTLRIDDDGVSREQDPAPPVRIGRSEITQIVETDAGIAVMAPSPERCIGIPTALEGYAEAREMLVVWRTIDTKRRTFPEVVTGALALGLMACGAGSALAPWPWVVAPTLLLWAAIGYGIHITRKSVQIARSQKNAVTIVGIWFALAPFGRLMLSGLSTFLEKLTDWH